jgi:antitoxin Phd
MKEYTFSQARQEFSSVLNLSEIEGEVRIKRRDGRVFAIHPVMNPISPLDVKGVNLELSKNELLGFIHASRRGARS